MTSDLRLKLASPKIITYHSFLADFHLKTCLFIAQMMFQVQGKAKTKTISHRAVAGAAGEAFPPAKLFTTPLRKMFLLERRRKGIIMPPLICLP